jgi:hypothetical protein
MKKVLIILIISIFSCDLFTKKSGDNNESQSYNSGLKQTTSTDDLGMNLGGIEDWSSAWVFVDRMKMAREWIPYDADGNGGWESDAEVPTGSNGYPLQVPFGETPQAVRTLVFRGFDTYPSGNYTLIFEGEGEVTLSFDGRGEFTEPDTPHSFEIDSPSTGGLLLSITRSNVNNPIRNIRIIMPGFENNYEEQIFHPLFLERLEGFKVLRFMDWGKTNNSPVISWEDRTTPHFYTQTLDTGVAPEYIVSLSNRLDIDPWICIPHLADDNYVKELAKLLVQNLDVSRKIYVEYSNEIWNNQFSQAHYCTDQGMALGLSSNEFQSRLYYNSRRSAEIFKIFEEEIDDNSRIVRVIASQAANSWTAEQLLEGLNDSSINPTSARADQLAIAPYFGGSIADDIVENGEVDSITISEILERAEDAVILQTGVWTRENKNVADDFNVGLITYEGGQHLVGTGGNENNEILTEKLILANKDPYMKDIYSKMFDTWFQKGGSLFSVFSNIGSSSKWGSWGVLEYQNQPTEHAPKFDAILDQF